MKTAWTITSALMAVAVIIIGLLAAPLVFGSRLMPGMYLDTVSVGGLTNEDLQGVIQRYDAALQEYRVTVRLNDATHEYALRDLGVHVDEKATQEALQRASLNNFGVSQVQPVLTINAAAARASLHGDFVGQLALPTNASLTITPTDQLVVTPSKSGEQIDTNVLLRDIGRRVAEKSNRPIEAVVVIAEAPIQDNEVNGAKQLAERLLRDGLILAFEDKQFDMKAFTLRRLMTFTEQTDAHDPNNTVLGVRFDEAGLKDYLETTIVPEVNQEAVDARFEVATADIVQMQTAGINTAQAATVPTSSEEQSLHGVRVSQFAMPQRGLALNVEESIQSIQTQLSQQETRAQLVVDVTNPEVTEVEDIRKLGVSQLLGRGESDFAGSPRNRVHNIHVGAAKYHGLLIAPGEEFSFNKFLGPVDAENGFKPELVIKENVTVPEFGGGLCQVSSTIFRAATYSGQKITTRRNHSYAVAYYGTPGFDATIYPPYTDFRFLNNTPGYILIQTRIEGTKLIFEFWGTDDGREVIVDGPHPYNRQPDGSVKATLTQTVKKDGEAVIEDTFYSNYKSPKLFPKVLAANGEAPPKPVESSTDTTTNEPPANTATPTPSAPAKNENKKP